MSKLRQYLLMLVVFAGLMSTERFGIGPEPQHSFFTASSISCHPLRQIPHIVSIDGKLPWNDSWFEPQVAQEEILSTLSEYHRSHRPPLKPKRWPDVKVLSIERSEHRESAYVVSWQAQYEVAACKKVPQGKEKLPRLTALIQEK